jgi:hypothetical protein
MRLRPRLHRGTIRCCHRAGRAWTVDHDAGLVSFLDAPADPPHRAGRVHRGSTLPRQGYPPGNDRVVSPWRIIGRRDGAGTATNRLTGHSGFLTQRDRRQNSGHSVDESVRAGPGSKDPPKDPVQEVEPKEVRTQPCPIDDRRSDLSGSNGWTGNSGTGLPRMPESLRRPGVNRHWASRATRVVRSPTSCWGAGR